MMSLTSPEEPLFYLSRKQLFHNYKKRANPIYLKSCAFFGATLIDRTSTLDSGFNFKIIDQLPVETTSLTFEEICVLRAQEIINSNRSNLHVLWSGGIDSTLTLISLIQELEKQNQIERLKVILSKESINEYATFFQDIIKDKLAFTLIEETIYDSISPNDIIITGEHGDQLFGSDKLKNPIITGDAFSPYEEILDFIISRKFGTDKHTYPIIEYLNPLIQKAPFKIVTLYDYMWWLNISLKWQTVSMRLIHGLERQASDLDQTVFHFFKNKDFQRWSIHNHTQKIKKEWNSYKYIAKEIIFKFHKDQDYLLHKEKEPSLKEVIALKTEPSNLLKRWISI